MPFLFFGLKAVAGGSRVLACASSHGCSSPALPQHTHCRSAEMPPSHCLQDVKNSNTGSQGTRRCLWAVRGTTDKREPPSSPSHTLLPLQLENNGGNLYEPAYKTTPCSETKPDVSVWNRHLSAQARLMAQLRLLIITSLAPGMVTFFPQLLNKLITSWTRRSADAFEALLT